MNGNVLHSEIVGAIKMKTRLSGMPELRLGLNDRVQFETMGRGPNLGKDDDGFSFLFGFHFY